MPRLTPLFYAACLLAARAPLASDQAPSGEVYVGPLAQRFRPTGTQRDRIPPLKKLDPVDFIVLSAERQ